MNLHGSEGAERPDFTQKTLKLGKQERRDIEELAGKNGKLNNGLKAAQETTAGLEEAVRGIETGHDMKRRTAGR